MDPSRFARACVTVTKSRLQEYIRPTSRVPALMALMRYASPLPLISDTTSRVSSLHRNYGNRSDLFHHQQTLSNLISDFLGPTVLGRRLEVSGFVALKGVGVIGVSSRDAYGSRSSALSPSCAARKRNTSGGMTSPGERSRPG